VYLARERVSGASVMVYPNLGVLLELLNEEQLGWGVSRDDETLRSMRRRRRRRLDLPAHPSRRRTLDVHSQYVFP
jgi:hypothetical protein